MVIRGKSRGNGKQLALYLLAQRENDHEPIVMQMRGFADRDPIAALVNAGLDVASVSTSNKPFYHGILNPREGEASNMSPEQWVFAADVMEKHLKFENLPRLIVLHEKGGRSHAHVVWLRLDYTTAKLRPDKFNFYKHNSARADIEKKLGHERTNVKRNRMNEPGHKEFLTLLWSKSSNADEFIIDARNAGYEIGQGLENRPFRAITPEGTSLDLVRQLKGFKIRDVRERFKGYSLPTEAQALKANKRQHTAQQQVIEKDRQDDVWRNFFDKDLSPANDNRQTTFDQLMQEQATRQKRRNQRDLGD